jgi:hypothetical protein
MNRFASAPWPLKAAYVATLDPNAIRDMAAIAHHRGWSIVKAQGSAEFRREAWLAGRSLGLEVRGYRPTERDLQDLHRPSAERQLGFCLLQGP